MSDFILRPARSADADAILDCWHGSFGDREEFILDFFASADPLRHAVAAEADGRVRSVMFAFDDLDFGGVRASYLYALCTHPDFRRRGMGGAVVAQLMRESLDAGAEFVCLSPAGAGLERWYCDTLGMRPLQRARDELLEKEPPREGASCAIIPAADYARLRRAAVNVTPQILAAQETLYRHYGGVMLRAEIDGETVLACAEPRGDAVLLRDLVCPPALRRRAAAVVSAHLWNKNVFLRRTGGEGEALIGLSPTGAYPPCLAGEPFPFTLG